MLHSVGLFSLLLTVGLSAGHERCVPQGQDAVGRLNTNVNSTAAEKKLDQSPALAKETPQVKRAKEPAKEMAARSPIARRLGRRVPGGPLAKSREAEEASSEERENPLEIELPRRFDGDRMPGEPTFCAERKHRPKKE